MIEPFEAGVLEVGDGHRIAWESVGSPTGKPAVVLHGGPGSGCSAWHRTMFDPERYRVVLFDQRGCGRSHPSAGDPSTDLSAITTQALVDDVERLRVTLGIERWLVWGGSWGSTLALAYAVAHPGRLSELVLWGVTTGRHSEVDRVFRGGLSERYPAAWAELRSAVAADVDRDVPARSLALLRDSDPVARRGAATAWCRWESAIETWPPRTGLSERYRDPAFAMTFATLVTHFASNDLFLLDGELLDGARAKLGDVPTVLIAGRNDLQAPLDNAEALHAAMPHARLLVVDDAGHLGDDPAIERELRRATDRFAGGQAG